MKLRNTILNTTAALICSAALIAISVPALAHGGDIGVEVEDGRIAIGLVDEHDEFISGVRVFGADLEELDLGSTSLYYTTHPGFDAEPGTFPWPGSVGFGLGNALLAWTGGGFAATGGETMTVVHSGSGQQVTTGAGAVPGFGLPVAADGHWHTHFTFFLNGAGGAPADGIYLLELSLWSSDASIAASKPFWIAFSKNGGEEEHHAAVHWAEEHLVPEPSGAAALGAGLICMLSGMRRRARRMD